MGAPHSAPETPETPRTPKTPKTPGRLTIKKVILFAAQSKPRMNRTLSLPNEIVKREDERTKGVANVTRRRGNGDVKIRSG